MSKVTLQTLSLIIIASTPVAIWSSLEPIVNRFDSISQTLTSIGQISALVGTVLFSLGLVMRSKFSVFNNNTLRIKTDIVAILLLLTHPIMLVAKLPVFIESKTWAFSFGVYALLLLLSYWLISLAAGTNKYLKATPVILGTVLFLGTLHAFFIPSDLSRSPLLQGYMLGVIFSSLSIYLLQYFAGRFSLFKASRANIEAK